MIKYISITAQQLMSKWLSSGLVEPSESQKIKNFILSQEETNPLPLYMHILIGIGVFIGAFFFSIFVWALFDELMKKGPFVHMILGLICVGLAILFDRRLRHAHKTIKYYFLMQWFLCVMLVGKILFVYGFYGLIRPLLRDIPVGFGDLGEWSFYHFISSCVFAFSIFLITVLTYPLYRVSVDRFLSVLAFFIVLLYITASERVLPVTISWPIFLLLQILAIAFLFLHEKARGAYRPIAYAAACSLIITIVYYTIFAGGWFGVSRHNEYIDQLLFVLSLMGLIIWVVGGFKKIKSEPIVVALLGVVLLGALTISSPGILFSLCLLVLGYALYDLVFLVAGIILMPFFISQYYYNMQLTLLVKSGVLVASGLLLLLGYTYMKYKQFDRGV